MRPRRLVGHRLLVILRRRRGGHHGVPRLGELVIDPPDDARTVADSGGEDR